MTKPLTIYGDPVDEGAVKQMHTCLADEHAVAGALMADHHLGYSMPIGGVILYKGAISPSGVGFDIACGNKAVQTELKRSELDAKDPAWIKTVMDAVFDKIEFGIGRSSGHMYDHALFESEVWRAIDAEGKKGGDRSLKQKARAQLGTVGSGNHYVDILVDEHDHIWIAVHFGSRGFGHTVASGFLAIAAGKTFTDKVKEAEKPSMLELGTEAGELYIAAMNLAGEYAYAGRDIVVDQVLQILGDPEVLESVHCHHNFAWQLGPDEWVVRKGATPLDHSLAFIGGSMGERSAVVSVEPSSRMATESLSSAPHGAGRAMSRTKAGGKMRHVKEERRKPNGERYTFRGRKRDASTGAIDWPKVHAELEARGITVMGAGAEEAPDAYKNLEQVLTHHPNVMVHNWLEPIGVAMAPADTFDPFAD